MTWTHMKLDARQMKIKRQMEAREEKELHNRDIFNHGYDAGEPPQGAYEPNRE